jgi:dephospho-CoA kinase
MGMDGRLRAHWIGPRYSEIGRDWEMSFLARRKLPVVVGLTGPSRVGKTMVAKRLVTEYDFHYESMAVVLRQMAAMLGEDRRSWQALSRVSQTLRRELGPDVIARRILERMAGLKGVDRIVVDGILHPADVKTLGEHSQFFLIGLAASREARAREAMRWYPQDSEAIRRDLEQRDEFEHYDYQKFLQQRKDGGQAAPPDEVEKRRPDVLACLAQVEAGYLIDLDDQAFNMETIFVPVDGIVENILLEVTGSK